MDYTHVSGQFMVRLEDGTSLMFSNSSLTPSCLPTEDQIQKKIIGIQWSYAFCGEQNFGIEPMEIAFDAKSDRIIKQIPKELTVDTQDDVSILKYGHTSISPLMLESAKEVGMVGYWDDSNFIICASQKYEPIIENIIDFIEPYKVKFGFRTVFGGQNLMIIPV